MILNCWNLLKWKSVNLLSFYEFDGDNTPIIRGSALGGLNGDAKMGR
jgi:elongation factor Tu